jgi:hypothetical protein
VISTYHCPAFGIGVAALQALGPSAAPAQRAHLHAQTPEHKRTKKDPGNIEMEATHTCICDKILGVIELEAYARMI